VDLLMSKHDHGVLVEIFDDLVQAEEFFQTAKACGLVEELDD
jgi:hypothetical protein